MGLMDVDRGDLNRSGELNRPGELERRLIQCTRCGQCMKDCPVYKETLDEQYTARSKVNLIKAVYYHDRFPLTDGLRDIAETCLLCRACLAACPNEVDGPEFTLFLREKLVERFGQSGARRAVFDGLLPRPGALSGVARVAAFGQALRLDRAAAAVAGAFSTVTRQVIDYAPRLASRSLTAVHPTGSTLAPAGRPKARVAYFHGCLSNLVFPDTGLATIDVLRLNGYEVVIPAQGCCGVPASSNGDVEAARTMARANVDSLTRAGCDWIVTDCASCGSTLKEYGRLLGGDEARIVSSKVRDISELLVGEGFDRTGLGRVDLTVTYHDPCHLVRYQNIAAEPRAILRSIPGLTLAEMKEADRCCGASGSFVLTHHRLSLKIGDRKARNVLETGAAAVATGCPSCRMQISDATKRAGHELAVLHPVELLARAYAAGDARPAADHTDDADPKAVEHVI